MTSAFASLRAKSSRCLWTCRYAQVDADQPARRLVLDGALGIHGKLAIVAIGAAHEAHPLDLLGREGFDLLLLVPDEPLS